MRLAALTASSEDVEELSKTFRMARPSVEEINRSATPPQRVQVKPSAPSRAPREETAKAGSGYLLLAIIVLVVIGLISSILF
jgi:hypothetical protein